MYYIQNWDVDYKTRRDVEWTLTGRTLLISLAEMSGDCTSLGERRRAGENFLGDDGDVAHSAREPSDVLSDDAGSTQLLKSTRFNSKLLAVRANAGPCIAGSDARQVAATESLPVRQGLDLCWGAVAKLEPALRASKVRGAGLAGGAASSTAKHVH